MENKQNPFRVTQPMTFQQHHLYQWGVLPVYTKQLPVPLGTYISHSSSLIDGSGMNICNYFLSNYDFFMVISKQKLVLFFTKM